MMRPVRYILFISVLLLHLSPTAKAQTTPGDKLKDSLQQALAHSKDDTSRIKLFYLLGSAYATGDSATAARYARECKDLATRIGWQRGLGLSYLLAARICRNSSDNNG